jgi:hypothetical protein
MLEKYLRMFADLRTDKNRTRWSALTRFQAPHKPFVLFSGMDLIVQGQITKKDMRICPVCGSEMVIKVARKGKHPGQKFWLLRAWDGPRQGF